MGRVVSNDVSAIIPEIWSTMVQIPLRKSLVSIASIANTRLEENLRNGDTIHVPRHGDLSAQTYVPGTPLSATNLDYAFDTIVVSTYKHATFYIDQVEDLQANIDQISPLAEEAAYRLKDAIDTHVFANITNIINIFTGARKVLRDLNVEEIGAWAAVITPKIAADLELKATTVGFNFADSTLRNGFIGNFLGFDVFISKNLPSGACSAISPQVSGGAVSATTCKALYFGRKGTVDLIMQKAPSLEIRKTEDKLGANFITWTVYGSGVLTKNRSRGLNVPIQSTFY